MRKIRLVVAIFIAALAFSQMELVTASSAVSTASTASMASGEVIWTNPPESKGRIRKDDNDMDRFEYNVNAGDTRPYGWQPSVGTRSTFTEGPGNTASNVTAVDDPAGVPPDPGCGA